MKRIDFEHGTITGNILGAALPMLVAQLLSLLYNIVDRIYIARIPDVGTTALGAVGLCFPIIVIITAFSNLFGTGGAPLFSIFRGKKDPDTARRIMNTSFTMLCVCAMVLMAVGFLFARPILILFGASAEAIVYAYPYMMLYLIGTLPSMIAVGMNPFINAQGYSSIGMLSVAIGAGTNLVLDPLFIFALGLGVRGAAIATVISQCISAALVVRCLVKETGPLRLDFRQLKIYPIKLKQIMQVGIPAGIQGMLFSLANVTVQSSVNSFGEVIMAGSSAAISIEQFIYSNINAFYQANVAFTSQNYGAGDYRRIKKIAMISVVTGVVTTELLSVLAVYFGPQLLGIYSPSAEVVAAGMVRLRWIALFYGLDAIMDVIVGSLRGVGYNILPMLVTLMGACASRLIWLSTVFRLPAYHRIEMVYIVYPLSWVLTATTHLICYFFVSRKVDRELRAHEAELAARMEESPEEADS